VRSAASCARAAGTSSPGPAFAKATAGKLERRASAMLAS
jgi:hypothetical protein